MDPSKAGGGPILFPQPNLEALTAEWSEQRVLPPDPRIPKDLQLFYRLTLDGYLACSRWRLQGVYQLQLVHRCVAPAGFASEAAPIAGRWPTVEEMLDALRRFTQPGLAFMLILTTAPTDVPTPNPTAVGLSQIPTVNVPDLFQARNRRQ
jgi:hypothetical protein